MPRSGREELHQLAQGPITQEPGDGRSTTAGLAGSFLALEPGQIAGLVGSPGFGLTRIGLRMLADRAALGPVAILDVRGWMCPSAAWEVGISAERLIVVRCDDPVAWGRVAATLIEGVRGLYAEVPPGIRDPGLRKLGALARTHRTPLVLRPIRGDLPTGITHLRLEAKQVIWDGPDLGHGRLESRRIVIEASGKATRGMRRTVEVEDHGADALRLVSRLAAAPVGRAV